MKFGICLTFGFCIALFACSSSNLGKTDLNRNEINTPDSPISRYLPLPGPPSPLPETPFPPETLIPPLLQSGGFLTCPMTEGSISTSPSHFPGFSGTIQSCERVNLGTSRSYRITDSNGAHFFVKTPADQHLIPLLAEVGGSKLGAYLMPGLVFPADLIQISGRSYVIQPLIEFDSDATRHLFRPANGELFSLERFSPLQREQLFAHMVTDHLLRNYDAHTGQFGINRNGNVIGYDKGMAYWWSIDHPLFHFVPPPTFDPRRNWPPLAPDQVTYRIFANYLSNNRAELERILASGQVQGVFERAALLTAEQAREWMGPYFRMTVSRSRSHPEEYYNEFLARFANARTEVYQYFGLSI